MKLVSVCSPSHETLKDEWFLRTLQDDYEVCTYRCDVRGLGEYLQEDWTKAVLFKSATIIEAIQKNWGDVFVYSDVDVTFFAPTKTTILTRLADKDIVCQLNDPRGNLCTGFFGIRANEATLELWRGVQKAVQREGRDQIAFNRLVRESKDLRAGYLPSSFFGSGTFTGRVCRGNERFYVPPAPVMFHANYTVGVENKIRLLSRAQRVVERSEWGRAANNLFFRVKGGHTITRAVETLIRRDRIEPLRKSPSPILDRVFSRPPSVALDLSTACQLKCPSCPTATGIIAKSIGAGFLTAEHFRQFVRDHPWVSDVELSNWGEVFLNPDFEQILHHADQQHVALRVNNGANLDRASERALEAVVKYKLRSLSCSIDAASQQAYAVYRVKGDFERVISHIRQINAFKRKYRSPYPTLRWQFVPFGHNTHELGKAREMARELGMEFYVKLSWNDLYAEDFSPVTDRELIRRESGLGVADRREYEEKFHRNFLAPACHQLWLRPRINFDGRLLGCAVNYWDDFGNVFSDGLEACLNGEKMQRTKDMLMGLREADEKSPCLRCKVYQSMSDKNAWVRPEDLASPSPHIQSRHLNRLINSMPHPKLSALVGRLFERSVGLYHRVTAS